jgi:hypothetical protein
MTVQQLIDIPNRVPDKTGDVAMFYDSDPRGRVVDVYIVPSGVILADEGDRVTELVEEAVKVL